MCGLAGKAENCKQYYRCMLDIYVDENKHPLPWANEQKANLAEAYTSLDSLPDKNSDLPAGVISSGWGGTVHPFANPQTHKEADFYQNGDGPGYDDMAYNHVYIYGYRRQATNGLTLLTLTHNCSTRNSEKKQVNYRLEDRGPETRTRYQAKIPNLNRFFEFDLPEQFLNQMDAKIELNDKPDIDLYKKLLNKK